MGSAGFISVASSKSCSTGSEKFVMVMKGCYSERAVKVPRLLEHVENDSQVFRESGGSGLGFGFHATSELPSEMVVV